MKIEQKVRLKGSKETKQLLRNIDIGIVLPDKGRNICR